MLLPTRKTGCVQTELNAPFCKFQEPNSKNQIPRRLWVLEISFLVSWSFPSVGLEDSVHPTGLAHSWIEELRNGNQVDDHVPLSRAQMDWPRNCRRRLEASW